MGQVFSRQVRRFLSKVFLGLIIVFWIDAGSAIAWSPIAISQLPSLPQSNSSQLPNGVTRQGLLEATDVKLGGKAIFKIASPAVFNRSELGDRIPVEVRARQIEANLEQILRSDRASDSSEERSTPLDPETIRVYIEILNRQPLLYVKDAGLVEPRVLLTVTDTDAQYHGTTKEILAGRWQKILEKELRQALEFRKPEALKQQINDAIKIAIATVAASILLLAIWKVLAWREKALKQYQASQAIAPFPSDEVLSEPVVREHKPQLLEILRQQFIHQFSIQRRLQIVNLLQWLVFWAIAFVWVAGIAATLYQFPLTRPFATGFASTPILILAAWFITGLINRSIGLAIDRFIKTWEKNTLTLENSQRRSQRLATTVSALKGLITVFIYCFVIVWVLQFLNIAPVSLLAFGTLLALAISFGVQNVIKDLVNGILILMEDQYAVGDYIVVGSASGVVENVNLRITQIRSADGRLITLPNSSIAQVDNLTRLWSRSDFVVEVAYNTDVDKALAIVMQEATQLANDPEWKSTILDVGEVFGIERISHSGIEIKIWIKTLPLKQFVVARELRRRLKIAFDRHGIHIGIPQQMLSGSFRDAIGDFIPHNSDLSPDNPPKT
ncbi:mechanosensitive ion channel family protein [Pseudanabaena sp. PCC 6802]|uniref:mechanosensitive ion channel family protein n=1 Tax=Pseudanabaena sp. PCC 6802 TaxID=118173 RepID=UPI000346EF23|nr:mechanosensitive ion channel family protein [Pseudanabaena sp. PCC 6802]